MATSRSTQQSMTPNKPAMDLSTRSSPLEKCSFACHMFMFPIGLTYLLWILIPDEVLETNLGITYYPRKEYAENIPVSLLFLFLAAPFLYAAFNSFTVPSLDSMDCHVDIYTRKATLKESLIAQYGRSPESLLPEICDLDPATLIWYRNESPPEGKLNDGEAIDDINR